MNTHSEHRRKAKTELVIDGYIYELNRSFPSDIKKEIYKYLTNYFWDINVNSISDCDDQHFKSVVLWSVEDGFSIIF